MNLPDELAKAFNQESQGEAQITVRALSNIEGGLGDTYVVTDGQGLYLYSKKLGEEYQPRQLGMSDISVLRVDDDMPFAYLVIGNADGEIRLKFSSMDKSDLDQLVEQWSAASSAEAPAAPAAELATPTPAPTGAPAAEPMAAGAAASEVTPLVTFAAAVYAMMEADGAVDPDEMHILTRLITDVKIVNRGIRYLEKHGIDAVMAQVAEEFDTSQKLCLMANLLEVAMVDLLLRSKEQTLLDRFREALGTDDNNYEAIYDILVIKNNMAVFPAEEQQRRGCFRPGGWYTKAFCQGAHVSGC